MVSTVMRIWLRHDRLAACIVGFTLSGGLCRSGTTERVRVSLVWVGYSHGSGCHWHGRGSCISSLLVIQGLCEALGLWGVHSVSFGGNACGVLAHREARLANCWARYGSCLHGNFPADLFSRTTVLVNRRRMGCHSSYRSYACYFFGFRFSDC